MAKFSSFLFLFEGLLDVEVDEIGEGEHGSKQGVVGAAGGLGGNGIVGFGCCWLLIHLEKGVGTEVGASASGKTSCSLIHHDEGGIIALLLLPSLKG